MGKVLTPVRYSSTMSDVCCLGGGSPRSWWLRMSSPVAPANAGRSGSVATKRAEMEV